MRCISSSNFYKLDGHIEKSGLYKKNKHMHDETCEEKEIFFLK